MKESLKQYVEYVESEDEFSYKVNYWDYRKGFFPVSY